MKTNIENTKSGLKSRAEQLSTTSSTQPPGASAQNGQSGTDHRPPIDREARQRNRCLSTDGVLNLLTGTVPEVYRVAEVVGEWVWVQFSEAPAAEIRQKLSQLGFHWNRERQTWQHPCGTFCKASSQDPREWYGSYFPARKPAV